MSTTTPSSPARRHPLPTFLVLPLLILVLAPPPSAADTDGTLEADTVAPASHGGRGADDDDDDDLARLSDDEVSAIPVDRFRTLSAAQLNGLGRRLPTALAPEQVAALTPEQCGSFRFRLRGPQCASISADCIRHVGRNAAGLGAGCVSYLTPDAVSALRIVALGNMPVEAFAGFGTAALSHFGGNQCPFITSRAAVFLRSCRGLSRVCLRGMPRVSVRALQPACVRLLDPQSVRGVGSKFHAALSPAAFLAQTSAQLSGYKSADCAAFPGALWPRLRRHQCANLTRLCAKALLQGEGRSGGGGGDDDDDDDTHECREAIGLRWPDLQGVPAGKGGVRRRRRTKARTPEVAAVVPAHVMVERQQPRSVATANMPGLIVLVAVLVLAAHLLRRRRARAADATSPIKGGEDGLHGRKTRRENPVRQQYQEL